MVFVGERNDNDWETYGSCSLCANGSTRVSYDCSDVRPNSYCPRKTCAGVCSTRRAVVHDHEDQDEMLALEHSLINNLPIMTETEEATTTINAARDRLIEMYELEIGRGGGGPKK